MKIAVLGATGNSGLQLVAQALQRGHSVSAIVRNPAKLTSFVQNERFKIVECNIFDSDKLSSCLEGHDCVLSALGAQGLIYKTKFYLETMQSIIAAMRKVKIRRIICITSQYAKPDPNYPIIYKLLLRPLLGRVLDSMFEMEQWMFSECNDIDYTIVRPPGLGDQPLQDKKVEVKPDEYYFADAPASRQMPRADVAKFILDELENNQYIQKGVAIALQK